jgi:hypothetical protein
MKDAPGFEVESQFVRQLLEMRRLWRTRRRSIRASVAAPVTPVVWRDQSRSLRTRATVRQTMSKNDITTLKPRCNDAFNTKISATKNLILSPSVVDFIVKKPCNDKIFALKNEIFGLFRFVEPRFLCK